MNPDFFLRIKVNPQFETSGTIITFIV